MFRTAPDDTGVVDQEIQLVQSRLSGARFGGDEFIVIVENIAHRIDAALVAERVQHAFQSRCRPERNSPYYRIGSTRSFNNLFSTRDTWMAQAFHVH